uniref:ER-bound oxygenase mpaB/mpaB'/Rubber oxygenase catalytic domain-containing protein n=1 Tax=Anopheles farauti TaxID=69004 RepID=A0A182QUX4_9DIPT
MTVPPVLELTDEEEEAKYYFTTLFAAFGKPCDAGTPADLQTHLPSWFDEDKFKLGQKFYQDNRFGILQANLCSLLVLLADPKGLRILEHTGKSSTTETARKRYVSTFMHMSDWYECELEPGSRSWKSLSQVRRMHLSASNSAKKRSLGFINQPEMALTTFGFMGFPLIRPHLLGIRYDNREAREGFVHFWAVIGYMLGVEDEHNMCLHRLEVVEMICHTVMRYVFVPSLQLETPLLRHMIGAIVDAFTPYMPFLSYESLMFLTRRLVGIPGYQYSVDMKKEFICRPILTEEDLKKVTDYMEPRDGYRQVMAMYRAIFSDKLRIYTIKELPDEINQNYLGTAVAGTNGTYTKLAVEDNDNPEQPQQQQRLNDAELQLNDLLGLKPNQQLIITEVADEHEWSTYMNDSRLKQLSARDQTNVRVTARTLNLSYSTIGRFANEATLSFILYRIRRLQAK